MPSVLPTKRHQARHHPRCTVTVHLLISQRRTLSPYSREAARLAGKRGLPVSLASKSRSVVRGAWRGEPGWGGRCSRTAWHNVGTYVSCRCPAGSLMGRHEGLTLPLTVESGHSLHSTQPPYGLTIIKLVLVLFVYKVKLRSVWKKKLAGGDRTLGDNFTVTY